MATVIDGWNRELSRLGIDYEIRAYENGSRDETLSRLREFSGKYPRLRVLTQADRGHGPAILRGYREAAAEWVFQVDGDDEIRPQAFAPFWEGREGYDLLLGARGNRRPPFFRRVATVMARSTVRILFGGRVRDPNCPFRLFRGSELSKLLPRLAADTFAPNVILTGLVAGAGLRIREIPVAFEPRRAGTSSIGRLSGEFAKALILCFFQTVSAALRQRGGDGTGR